MRAKFEVGNQVKVGARGPAGHQGRRFTVLSVERAASGRRIYVTGYRRGFDYRFPPLALASYQFERVRTFVRPHDGQITASGGVCEVNHA